MFKSLIVNSLALTEKHDYTIIDSNFQEKIKIKSDVPHIVSELAVITIYKNRKLPIAQNVARLYLWHEFRNKTRYSDQEFSLWKRLIDNERPELEYGSKYFQCVINNIRRFKEQGLDYVEKNFR